MTLKSEVAELRYEVAELSSSELRLTFTTVYHTGRIRITKRNYNALKANCGRNKTVRFASFRVIGMDINRSANSDSVKSEFNG